MIRKRFIILLILALMISAYGPLWITRWTWNHNVFAQAALQTVPIAFTGGAPGCTVLVPAVAGKQVWVNNGIMVLPAIGTGMTVQFLASTEAGPTGVSCNQAGITRTALTGFYAGPQVGTTAVNDAIYSFNGNPAIITPTGQGLLATISIATTGTGSQSAGGHLTFTQQ